MYFTKKKLKFIYFQAVFVAVGYYMSSYLNLYWQLTILALMAVSALISYIYVDICAVKTTNYSENNQLSIKT